MEGYPPWHDGAVFDSAGLPPYPPRHNAWQFPPPPVEKRWLWVAVLAAVAGLVAMVAMGTAAIVLGSRDFPGLIQDSDVTAVIADECELMRDTVDSLPVDGPVRQQVATLADQDRAVRIMLDDIRSDAGIDIRADRPTEAWLADWERLLLAREAYAARLVDGRPADLRIPVDEHGDEIQQRMNDVWAEGAACEVPPALLSPYPEPDSV